MVLEWDRGFLYTVARVLQVCAATAAAAAALCVRLWEYKGWRWGAGGGERTGRWRLGGVAVIVAGKEKKEGTHESHYEFTLFTQINQGRTHNIIQIHTKPLAVHFDLHGKCT